MGHEYSPIHEITPESKDWTSRVKVIQKSDVRIARLKGVDYQRILLGDDQGHTVEAITYAENIVLLGGVLVPGNYCIIKNAGVAPKGAYVNKIATCKYQWTLRKSTVVLPAPEVDVPFTGIEFQTVRSDEFHRYQDTGDLIHVACVFIAHKGSRWVPTREGNAQLHEYAAIDQELEPFVVSFWENSVPAEMFAIMNSVASMPSLLLLNFKVVSFYGLSLNSTSQTYVIQDMGDRNLASLDQWKKKHVQRISTLLAKGNLFAKKVIGSPKQPLNLTQVAKLKESTNDANFTVRVKARLDLEHQEFYYICCSVCFTGTTALDGITFTCTSNQCKQANESRIAAKGLRFVLTVYDDTGEIDVTFFGKEAETLLDEDRGAFLSRNTQILSGNEPFLHTPLGESSRAISGESQAKRKIDFHAMEGIVSTLDDSEPSKLSAMKGTPQCDSDCKVLSSTSGSPCTTIEVAAHLEDDSYDSDLGTKASRKLASHRKPSVTPARHVPHTASQNRHIARDLGGELKQPTTVLNKAADISILMDAGYSMAEASQAVEASLAVDESPTLGKRKKYGHVSPNETSARQSEIYDLTVDDDDDRDMPLSAMIAKKARQSGSITAFTTPPKGKPRPPPSTPRKKRGVAVQVKQALSSSSITPNSRTSNSELAAAPDINVQKKSTRGRVIKEKKLD